ncbi:MAG: hypothetical protein AVDCRST_MAG30-4271, partial [uncultured Solirubrobacteraceae bacterium]
MRLFRVLFGALVASQVAYSRL